MSIPVFLLKMLCGAVRARVNLNGVQVFRAMPGATKSAKVELNPWIVEGQNYVELFMGPCETPSGANLDLKVLQTGGKKEEKLAAFRWEPAKAPVDPRLPKKISHHEFKVDKAFGRWSWEEAPKTSPTDEDEKAICAIVAEMHKALSAKDAVEVTRLMEVKIEEMGRSFGVPADQMKADQEDFLKSLFKAGDWTLEPLDANGMTLMPAAEGRLLAVTDPGGRAPLRAVANKQPILFPLTVSRVGGAWKIVR